MTAPVAQNPAAGGAETTRDRFVHLHLHSEYSLLDGGNRLDKLVKRVKELGMSAVAVTDHGNMHAAVQFYEIAKREGVKPILGVEAYVAPGDRTDRTYTGVSDGGYHLVLLAENETGWENLLYLCSEAYLTGFYFKPRMDRAILEERNSGIIAINGHLGSEMGEHLLSYERTSDEAKWAAARESAEWHARVFADEGTGPRFFVELQHHVPEQIAINPHLVRMARELKLPLVCDNDSHFLLREDHDAHDTLICISTGKVKDDPQRMRYTPELYVKGPEEMCDVFESHYGPGWLDGVEDASADGADESVAAECLNNTVRIAERCSVEVPIGLNHAPVVFVNSPPVEALPSHDDPAFGGDLTAWYNDLSAKFSLEPFDEQSAEEVSKDELKEACDVALRLLSEAGMVWRYGPGIMDHRHGVIEGADDLGAHRSECSTDEERDGFDKWARLNRELKILADKLISAYFLIVWDFVNWGRQRGIPALARGSGVGTMVGYVLGLSNACPVRYGLLFERFTDPDRTEYPDIDIDLCQDGRAEVIDYVREKYGYVAQIITFGTLKARAAVRDVARVHEMPLGEADRLAKLIPETLGITLADAIQEEPDFKAALDADPVAKRVVETAMVIEGQARHSSVHAAGVIVATRPLSDIVPLYKASGSDDVITQWDGPTCEAMGLLKMDFLGLRTLSVIERAKTLIRDTLPEEAIWSAVGRSTEGGGAHPLDLDRLTYDDPRVFSIFQRGDTTGVFQFESGGMRRLLNEMKPDRLEDLIAANALFRPGPMDLIPDYNQRKHGEQAVPRVHEIVDKFTEPTYGVMVYQEQVMQIVHELGGIPLRAAYALIKAISKKKKDKIDAARPKFIEGAGTKGLDAKKADELFELILKFAGYGFNKSHSTGYAIVAYQTAYLKAFFPRHYMAAFLSFESQAQKVADWIPYLEDTKRTKTMDPGTGAVASAAIEVRPPAINRSEADFAVVYDKGEARDAAHGHIRFGLKAIKGAGAKAIESIIEQRRDEGAFASIFDFCERVSSGVCNKATIEALVKAGAFDEVHERSERASLVATIDAAVSAGQKIAQDKAAGQNQLFGFGGGEEESAASSPGPAEAAPLERAPAWSEAETLRQEKETLGFYVSSHPLDEWRCWTRAFTDLTCGALAGKAQDARVVVPAMVQSARTIVVRNGRSAGQKMAILTIEDATGTAEAVMFADRYKDFGHLLESDDPKFVLGRIDLSRGDPQIIVDRLVPVDGVPLEKGKLGVFVREPVLNGGSMAAAEALKSILDEIAGEGADAGHARPAKGAEPTVPLNVVVETTDSWVRLDPGRRVPLSEGVVRTLTGVLGEGSVRLLGGAWVELNQKRDKKYAKKKAV